MKNYKEYEIVSNLYGIFKCILKLNPERFANYHIDSVIDELLEIANLDESYQRECGKDLRDKIIFKLELDENYTINY